MKFTTTLEGNKEIKELFGAVAAKEATVVFADGMKKSADGEKINGMAKYVTANSTLTMTVGSTSEDFEGKPQQYAVNAKNFLGILDAELVFDSAVYRDVRDGKFFLGVEGKTEVEVPLLSEMPAEAKVKPSDVICRFAMTKEENSKMLRKGLSSTSESAGTGKTAGLNNATLQINPQTGDIVAFSTTGNMFSYCKAQAKIPKAKEGDEKAAKVMETINSNLKAFCADNKETQREDCLSIIIPHDEVVKLRALTGNADVVTYTVDRNHVSVTVGNRFQYSFTQGATAAMNVETMIAFMDKLKGDAVQVDKDGILNAVDLQNKIIAINGDAKKDPVRVKVGKALTCSSGKDWNTFSNSEVIKATGESEFYVNGSWFRHCLSMMDKGNLVINILDGKMVVLKNGTLDAPEEGAFVGLMMVNVAKAEADAEAEEEADAENEEVTEEAAS